KGTWKEVKSKNGVPKNIIPLDIQNSVKEQFKTAKIIGIEKVDKNRIEVDLDNGIELTFNKNGDLVEID
ncbi:MAG: PepSY-like domain-containing protein, partial [Paludibacteraceae bacterium]|nr:PepSY-like domain-containing protein [Paludibacteraceae bacterium]